eukprot:TRINITY_DN15300_c0_g1_i1.p1 TRINITY_DN15300_c0_g1~~TRINITY_DN15300_c0_g1_i1.p1  ORF type:complete len:619 (+),score=131.25 TRINITY_DN15300_c0_g1_i1:25-1881(+)
MSVDFSVVFNVLDYGIRIYQKLDKIKKNVDSLPTELANLSTHFEITYHFNKKRMELEGSRFPPDIIQLKIDEIFTKIEIIIDQIIKFLQTQGSGKKFILVLKNIFRDSFDSKIQDLVMCDTLLVKMIDYLTLDLNIRMVEANNQIAEYLKQMQLDQKKYLLWLEDDESKVFWDRCFQGAEASEPSDTNFFNFLEMYFEKNFPYINIEADLEKLRPMLLRRIDKDNNKKIHIKEINKFTEKKGLTKAIIDFMVQHGFEDPTIRHLKALNEDQTPVDPTKTIKMYCYSDFDSNNNNNSPYMSILPSIHTTVRHSQNSNSNLHAEPVNPYSGINQTKRNLPDGPVLLWVDPKGGDAEYEAFCRGGTYISRSATSKMAFEWLQDHRGQLILKHKEHLFRIITNRSRDGDEKAGETFFDALLKDEVWKDVPKLIYCKRIDLLKFSERDERRALWCSNKYDFAVRFASFGYLEGVPIHYWQRFQGPCTLFVLRAVSAKKERDFENFNYKITIDDLTVYDTKITDQWIEKNKEYYRLMFFGCYPQKESIVKISRNRKRDKLVKTSITRKFPESGYRVQQVHGRLTRHDTGDHGSPSSTKIPVEVSCYFVLNSSDYLWAKDILFKK